MTTTYFDTLIAVPIAQYRRGLEDARKKEEQLEQARERAVQQLRQQVIDLLGLLAAEMNAYLNDVSVRYEGGVITYAEVFLHRKAWQERLVPGIPLLYRGRKEGFRLEGDGDVTLTDETSWSKPDVAACLLRHQIRYEDAFKKHLTGRKNQLFTGFIISNRNRYGTREEGEKALQELLQLAPDEEARWREYYTAWLSWLEQRERDAAERQAALDRYRIAYSDWHKACQRITEHNERIAREVQAAVDREYQVYQLTYGVLAEDEDGGTERWLDQVEVLSPTADAGGYWSILDRGRVKKERIFHPVRISAPITRRVSEGKNLAWYGPEEFPGDVEIAYLAENLEEVREGMAALQQWPSVPRPEDFDLDADSQEVRDIRRSVYDDRDDIPF